MRRRTSVAAATTLGGGNDQSRATYSPDRVRSLGPGRTAGGPFGAALASRRGAVRGGDRRAPERAKRATGRTGRRDAAPPNEAQGRRGRRKAGAIRQSQGGRTGAGEGAREGGTVRQGENRGAGGRKAGSLRQAEAFMDLALMGQPPKVDRVREDLVEVPPADQPAPCSLAPPVASNRQPNELLIQNGLEPHDAADLEIAPKEMAHEGGMLLDDMERSVLDPVAERNHSAHPDALLLRRGDLVPDARLYSSGRCRRGLRSSLLQPSSA